MHTLDSLLDVLSPWDLVVTIDGRDYATRPVTIGGIAAIAAVTDSATPVDGSALAAVAAELFRDPKPQLGGEQVVAVLRAVLTYLGVKTRGLAGDDGPNVRPGGGDDTTDAAETVLSLIAAVCEAYPAVGPDGAAAMRVDVACMLLAGRVRLMRRIEGASNGSGEWAGRGGGGGEGIMWNEATTRADGTQAVPVRGLEGLRQFMRMSQGLSEGPSSRPTEPPAPRG